MARHYKQSFTESTQPARTSVCVKCNKERSLAFMEPTADCSNEYRCRSRNVCRKNKTGYKNSQNSLFSKSHI